MHKDVEGMTYFYQEFKHDVKRPSNDSTSKPLGFDSRKSSVKKNERLWPFPEVKVWASQMFLLVKLLPRGSS